MSLRWIYISIPWIFVCLGALYLRPLQMWILWGMTDWDPLTVGSLTGGGFVVALWCIFQVCSFLRRNDR